MTLFWAVIVFCSGRWADLSSNPRGEIVFGLLPLPWSEGLFLLTILRRYFQLQLFWVQPCQTNKRAALRLTPLYPTAANQRCQHRLVGLEARAINHISPACWSRCRRGCGCKALLCKLNQSEKFSSSPPLSAWRDLSLNTGGSAATGYAALFNKTVLNLSVFISHPHTHTHNLNKAILAEKSCQRKKERNRERKGERSEAGNNID